MKDEGSLNTADSDQTASKPQFQQPVSQEVPAGPTLSTMLGGFLSLTGGSIFYCLSALSIIYGIAKLMGPLLSESSIQDALPCITTLNIYELALLAVLITIIKLRNVTDDAVSLVIIIAVFLIGSGTVMDVVANTNPALSLKIGWACLLIGIVKIWLLRKHILPGLKRVYVAGLILLLYWNFIIPSQLALLMTTENVDVIARRSLWLNGWLIMLAGAVLILTKAAMTPVRDGRAARSKTPFLHTSAMVWIFSLVLLGAACAHQYLLAYIFDVVYKFGDYIPIIVVMVLLVLELIRYSGLKLEESAISLGMIPLVCIFISLASRSYVQLDCPVIDFFWSPRFLLGFMTISSVVYSARTEFKKYMFVALFYLLAFILIWTTVPGEELVLNWKVCGVLAAVCLLVMALIRKDPRLAQALVVLISVGLAASGHFKEYCAVHNIAIGVLTCIWIGLGSVLVYLIFGKLMDRRLAVLGFTFLVIPMMIDLADAKSAESILKAGGCLVAGGAIWYRGRDSVVASVFAMPALQRIYYISRQLTAWRYILFSFILLGVGAYASLKKAKSTPPERE